MDNIEKTGEGIYYFNKDIGKINSSHLSFIVEEAEKCERKRARLCLHRNSKDILQEMFIALNSQGYIRPHKHINKSESGHVIRGLADLIFFKEDGNIADILPIGDYNSGGYIYYRINKPIYHTQVLRTNSFIFHEVTKGPFNREDTILAPWAPEENDVVVKDYINELERKIRRFKEG